MAQEKFDLEEALKNLNNNPIVFTKILHYHEII